MENAKIFEVGLRLAAIDPTPLLSGHGAMKSIITAPWSFKKNSLLHSFLNSYRAIFLILIRGMLLMGEAKLDLITEIRFCHDVAEDVRKTTEYT